MICARRSRGGSAVQILADFLHRALMSTLANAVFDHDTDEENDPDFVPEAHSGLSKLGLYIMRRPFSLTSL